MTRILIVDDAIDLGRMLQDALKVTRPDTPITVVPSAEEALLEASRFKFDLLITDLRLPGMSGIELIRKIRIRQPDIKIILITGLSPDDRLVRQKDDVHPDVYMRKPLSSVKAFLESVDALMNRDQPGADEPELAMQTLAKTSPLVEPTGAVLPPPVDDESVPPEKVSQTAADLLVELASIFPGTPVEPVIAPSTLTSDTAPGAAGQDQDQETGVSAILSRLRSTLGALAAVLIDDRGRSVAQAGDLPEQMLLDHLVPAALAALSAGSKVAHELGAAYLSAAQAYRASNYDLILAPAGRHSLLIALKTGRTALKLAIAFEEVLAVQEELLSSLGAIGADVLAQPIPGTVPSAELLGKLGVTKSLRDEEILAELEETPLGQDPNLDKLEALVIEKSTGQLEIDDPDSFWEAAAENETKDVDTPGVLSYEQAQKLGLLKAQDED